MPASELSPKICLLSLWQRTEGICPLVTACPQVPPHRGSRGGAREVVPVTGDHRTERGQGSRCVATGRRERSGFLRWDALGVLQNPAPGHVCSCDAFEIIAHQPRRQRLFKKERQGFQWEGRELFPGAGGNGAHQRLGALAPPRRPPLPQGNQRSFCSHGPYRRYFCCKVFKR